MGNSASTPGGASTTPVGPTEEQKKAKAEALAAANAMPDGPEQAAQAAKAAALAAANAMVGGYSKRKNRKGRKGSKGIPSRRRLKIKSKRQSRKQ